MAGALPRSLKPLEPKYLRDIAAMQAADGNIDGAPASTAEDADTSADALRNVAATQDPYSALTEEILEHHGDPIHVISTQSAGS